MKIIHVASEAFPFSKTGGLADVVGTLPKRMAQIGHDVTVMVPLYRVTRERYPELILLDTKVWVDVPGGLMEFRLYETFVDGARFLFFEQDELFDRSGIYNEDGEDYGDNHIRFSSFCMACLNFIKHHNLKPEILHAHDWQAALIPVYQKLYFSDIGCKTVFTIHNLAFQGILYDKSMESIGLKGEHFYGAGLEFYGDINMLKAAVLQADLVTTVSPKYAEEVQTPAYGFKLDGLLKHNAHKLVGILNGIDYSVWNPETDENLEFHYHAGDLSGKEKVKRHFAEKWGLDPEKPLIVMISRLAEQKGIQMILDAAPDMANADANFVFLGDGTPDINQQFKGLESELPNVTVIIGYSEALSHQLYGAADFYLMPSLFEPCGLSQLIAMRYGAIPIARYTGGLADTVKDITVDGWGFVFDPTTGHALMHTIYRALSIYGTDQYHDLVQKVMSIDFSWVRSANETVQHYERLSGMDKGV